MDYSLFDLIAVLYKNTIEMDSDDLNKNKPIKKEKEQELIERARSILMKKLDTSKSIDGEIRISSQDYSEIVDCFTKENNYLVYRIALCELASKGDINRIIKKYNLNVFDTDEEPKSFESLNSNCRETGIIVLPYVKSLENTISVRNGDEFEDKKYKDAYYWYDDINNHLMENGVICVSKSDLNGYTIKNVIVDLFKNEDRDKIIIGVTPCCNNNFNDLMIKCNDIDEATLTQYFIIKEYKNPDLLTKKYINSLSLAKKQEVDILMGPELLGTSDLCNADEMGFNKLFQDFDGNPPDLIISPSLWKDKTNYISVFLKSGKLVGQQYKQNSFEEKNDGVLFQEDLRNSPKEILIVHVPGWGRITFPICVDFLVTDYRDILIKHLKSNLILCPSYTEGTAQFGNASGTIREFGARLVWLNSCSALRKNEGESKSVGLVSVPVTGPYDFVTSTKEICPQCNGTCYDHCLFIITIHIKRDGDKHCNDVEINHVFC